MVKGEIWWANLPDAPYGSEPGKRRPVVIGLVREPDGSRTSLAFFGAKAPKKCFFKQKLF